MDKIKNIIIGLLVFCFLGGIVSAQFGGGFGGGSGFGGELFRLSTTSTAVIPNNSRTIGLSYDRVAGVYTDLLDATNVLIGGLATGNLNMGGYNITNSGTITGTSFSATSTTATSTFAGDVRINNNNCINYSGNYGSSYWLAPFNGGFSIGATFATGTANTVYLQEFEVLCPTPVDSIHFVTGSATTSAPSVQVMIYQNASGVRETALSSTLIVKSATTTMGTAQATPTPIYFATTTLQAGLYYAGVEMMNSPTSYLRNGNQTHVVGWSQTFTDSGQDAPATPNALTNTQSNMPQIFIRVAR